jgi:transcriptional regulator with XRE-family HTH domain
VRQTDDWYWKQFGDWMRAARARQKPDAWTQERLAAELDKHGHRVTRAWVNQLEGGKRPSPELAQAIEELLGRAPSFTAPAVDQSELVGALMAQTEALNAQTLAFNAQAASIDRLVDVLTQRASERDVAIAAALRDIEVWREERRVEHGPQRPAPDPGSRPARRRPRAPAG